MRLLLPILLGVFTLACLGAAPTAARADPCTAALPKPGTVFSGTVRYVGDGDGLCVGESADPTAWIEVRLADFYAPELSEPDGRQAKAALEAVAMGRTVQCTARHRSYDRVVAECRLGGAPVAELLRRRGGRQGGNGWR